MKEADGAPVDYPIRLELAHAFLNLAYTQLPLKQWQSSFEAYKKVMLLYAADSGRVRHHWSMRSTERGKASRGWDRGKGRAAGRLGGRVRGRLHRPRTGTTTGSTARAGTVLGKYKGWERCNEPLEFNSGNSTPWLVYQ